MTFIGIDYGTRKCGLAKDAGPLAVPVGIFATKTVVQTLVEMAKTTKIEGFVIGRPDHADGRISHETELMRTFATGLKKAFPEIPVYEQDERYSSNYAYQSLEEAGIPKKFAGNIDDMAATIILEDFLNSRKSN